MNNDSNIHVVQLSEYTRPEITESKNREWVEFGTDNGFFNYCIDRFVNSPTNHTIINSIAAQIYGKGLDAFDKAQKPDEYAAMKTMFKKQCMKRLILDLKILGMGALQISYKGKKVDQVTHFPMETLRPEKCNDKGEIEAWYYHPNWAEAKRNDKPKRIPVFCSGATNEIFVIRRYISSMTYLSLPDWMGSAAYCELEENIADYLLNTVNNSFSSTTMINFPNGIPDRKKMVEIKNDVIRKLTGQHGDKVIVSFSETKDQSPEIISLPLQDAAATYEYLSEECSRKIMIGHRVTSPLLIGLRDGNSGLGSNADEIVNASRLFTNITIRPYQEQIIDALDEILAVNGLSLDMYFKTLEPLEFREADNVITQEQEEKEEDLNLSEHVCCAGQKPMITDEQEEGLLAILDQYGTDIDEEEWEFTSEEESEGEASHEAALEKLNFAVNLFDNTADVTEKSKWGDIGLYRVFYVYQGKNGKDDVDQKKSRKFCKEMIKRNKGKKYGLLYTKEQIDELSKAMPNPGLGPGGSDFYDLFQWAGGAYCHHKWQRKIFFRKRGADGRILPRSTTQGMENDNNVGDVRGVVKPKGKEGTAPIDKKGRGKLPKKK